MYTDEYQCMGRKKAAGQFLFQIFYLEVLSIEEIV